MSEEAAGKKGKGYWGRILDVDLEKGASERQEVGEDTYRRFLGGVGLGAKVLWDRMKPGTDPLGPDNLLGFVPGLLTDTGSLFTGRFLVVGKSPNTGGWGDANCGGHFSPFLKRCGVDGLFLHGVAEKPVYLLVDENKVEILDAGDLWGLDTVQTEEALEKRHGKRIQVACIGPGGEKRSYLAGISNDRGRFAARSGLGAVMGSKRVKAIVAAGRTRVGVDDKERMSALTKAFQERAPMEGALQKVLGDTALGFTGWLTRVNPMSMRQPADLWRMLLSKYGTTALTAMSAESGDSPIQNWKGVGHRDFPLKRAQRLGADAVKAREVKKYGCYSCPCRCGGIVKVEGGRWPIAEMHKPEYETLCAFGALCLNDDIDSIFMANEICNRGGLDTISVGSAVAFAIECVEQGLLSKEDVDGLDLRWGNGGAIVDLTRRIVAREGLGDVLADGVKIAAEKIGKGAEKYAVHAGGVEIPMHDPKFDPGQGVSYSCEPTPGRHTVSCYQYLELENLERKYSRAKTPPFMPSKAHKANPEGKGEMMVVGSFFKNLVDALGCCLFGTQVGGDIPLPEWANAATGFRLAPDEYLEIGERVGQLRHAFNVREGLNPARDFRMNGRAYGAPPQEAGPAKGLTVDMDGFVRSFYNAMHWDLETGRPARQYLVDLDLTEVAEALHAP